MSGKSRGAVRETRLAMRSPDVTGRAGRAWALSRPESTKRPDHAASLASYVVNVPGAHAYWSWWMVTMIHLRDIPGVRPAHKDYSEAEYEFSIVSLDPTHGEPPDIDGFELGTCEGFHHLTPPDVVKQFHSVTDDVVKTIALLAIRAICDGRLSPDQDFRSRWNQTIDDTVAHYVAGKHAVG